MSLTRPMKGGEDRPNNQFCEGFDIEKAFYDIRNYKDADQCIDFVSEVEYSQRINSKGDYLVSDYATFWHRKDNDVNQPVDLDNLDYYEERYHTWNADGSYVNKIMYDWGADTYNRPELEQSPFNVVRITRRDPNGVESYEIESPKWAGSTSPDFNAPIFGQQAYPLTAINPFEWNNRQETYNHDIYTPSSSDDAYSSKIYQIDQRDGINLPFYKDEDRVLVAEQEIDWDKDSKTASATFTYHRFDNVEDVKPHIQNYYYVKDLVELTYLAHQVGFAELQREIDANNLIVDQRFALTPEIFEVDKSWDITIETIHNFSVDDIKFLFNNLQDFKFTSSQKDLSEVKNTLCYNWNVTDQNKEPIDVHSIETLLTTGAGGDAFFNVRCEEGAWIKDTMVLEIDQLYGDYFMATLKGWWWGNDYFENPLGDLSANLRFTHR